MKLLYRYVMALTFTSYAICIGITLAFYIVIDLFGKFFRFTDYVELLQKTGQPPVSVWVLIAQYYYYHTPIILYQLIPIINLMAAMFAITSMARSNELVPLKACGISIYHLFVPLVIISLLSSIGMIALQEMVIPKFAEKTEAIERIEHGRKLQITNILYCDEHRRTFTIGRYYPITMECEYVRIFEPYSDVEESLKPKRILEARYGKWAIEKGQRYLVLLEGKEDIYDRQGVLTRTQALPKEGHKFQTEMRHRHLTYPEEKHVDTASTKTLLKTLRTKPNFTQARVTLYSRVSFPLTTVILLLLGVPWILRQNTRNLFMGSAICLIAAGAFYGCHLTCINLGYKDILNPLFAAWWTNVLFGALGISFLTILHT